MRRLKNDLILIIAFVAAVFVVFSVFLITRKDGDTVKVKINGVTTAEYKLNQDFTTVIDSYNNGKNTLVIENGRVYIKDADCPDKICENHRPISKSGETIVCLPNRLIIIIERSKGENNPDIVV
ncbi:MAG: NusG domain II-containing protein [Clostridia bacterium]|nr:NusG domain II-containing protein [Clostridia bacterium]